MSKVSYLLIGASFALGMSGAFAECNYPKSVSVPDGSTASEEEMLAGRTAVQEYMAAMNEYLACLDEEAARLGEEESSEQKQLHVQRHNAAVDDMEAVAAEFNDELAAYKTRN